MFSSGITALNGEALMSTIGKQSNTNNFWFFFYQEKRTKPHIGKNAALS